MQQFNLPEKRVLRLGRRTRPSVWLIGTWRSDKEKTLRRWDRNGAPRPDGARRSFVEGQLGRSVNRFTTTRWHHSYDGHGFTLPYRVVWQNRSEVFLVYSDRRHEYGELLMFLSPSTYSVFRSGYVEFFSKGTA